MNLPDPEESFLKESNKLLYNFLWNGKNDKIKDLVCVKSMKLVVRKWLI